MLSPRAGSPRRRWSLMAGTAVLGLVSLTGCQVEYAGMTLPSGKYMHDDVQYFQEGPAFPYANTQAATQRARMQAQGLTPPPPPSTVAPNDAATTPAAATAPAKAGNMGAPAAPAAGAVPPANAPAAGAKPPAPVPPPPAADEPK
jgi:hypothetical protein